MLLCCNTSFTFHNNPKDLDLSYKMDLDFWDCFVSKKLCHITEEVQYAAAASLKGFKINNYTSTFFMPFLPRTTIFTEKKNMYEAYMYAGKFHQSFLNYFNKLLMLETAEPCCLG